MHGIVRFTAGADNYCNISADLAIKAMRKAGGILAAPRTDPDDLHGHMTVIKVLSMANLMSFDYDSISGSAYSLTYINDAGRKLHTVVLGALIDHPDTPVARLKIHYQFIQEAPEPEPYSPDFIELRHIIHANLVAGMQSEAGKREEDLTLADCVELIQEAGDGYYKHYNRGIIPKRWSTA